MNDIYIDKATLIDNKLRVLPSKFYSPTTRIERLRRVSSPTIEVRVTTWGIELGSAVQLGDPALVFVLPLKDWEDQKRGNSVVVGVERPVTPSRSRAVVTSQLRRRL
jgi:hypothetical protein